jgi:putative holliday junction resolvase
MGRILAVDYGKKRTGIAVTDPLRIIATALDTVATHELMLFLKSYLQKEAVDEFVVGMPKTLKNEDSEIAPLVRNFVSALARTFPGKTIHLVDERFTSALAQRALIEGGMKKKDRQVKGNVDKVSAVIILQDFMNRIER